MGSFLPFSRVAALVMRADRWTAGSELMQAANPRGWTRFVADSQLASDNREAIDACSDAAARSGKTQHCTVTLAPPPNPMSPRQPKQVLFQCRKRAGRGHRSLTRNQMAWLSHPRARCA
jgi:hypothetical protein